MSQKASILERVREMTRHALEREAEKLLALDVVKEGISKAAGEGFTKLYITPERPLDLSGTDTGKATVAALRAERFTLEWERKIHSDARPWSILVVSW